MIRQTRKLRKTKDGVVEAFVTVSGVLLLASLAPALSSGLGMKQSQDRALADHSRPSEVRVNPQNELNYVWIPPGTFMMGCSPGDMECRRPEKPAHRVTITKGFWIGQTEATVAAYQRFASATNREMPFAPSFNSGWTNPGMPMININWEEAQAFCAWSGGRLPTEAEWEYAARGGDPHPRYGQLDDIAWYGKNSGGRAHDVAQKQANGFGLYDSLGNVWEWVNDLYNEDYYRDSPQRDPTGPAKGEYRVLRGGSWFYFPRFVRVSVRLAGDPDGRVGNFGVRCVVRMPDP